MPEATHCSCAVANSASLGNMRGIVGPFLEHWRMLGGFSSTTAGWLTAGPVDCLVTAHMICNEYIVRAGVHKNSYHAILVACLAPLLLRPPAASLA
jgi:hypothetical protein